MTIDIQNAILSLSYVHLRTFQLVAMGSNVRQAAEVLHRTQPAISLSIREMEYRLGHPLFDRERKMELTPFGRACLPVISTYLMHHANMCAELQRLANGNAGFAAMGTIPITSGWLAKAIGRFQQAAPDAKLALRSDNVSALKDLLRKREIDFCLCTHLKPSEEFIFKPVTRRPFGLVCHRSHPLAVRDAMCWDELQDIQLIESALLREEFVAELKTPIHVSTILAANLQIMNALLEEQVGVTVLPEYAVIRNGLDLKFIPLQEPTLESTLGILKLADTPHNPTARLLESIVATELKNQFEP